MQISVAVIIPLITFSSNCIMVYHSNVKYSTTLALVMRFQLANEACDLRTFCFISQGLPIPLGIHCMVTGPKWCSVHAVKHPICNCVHSYSISPCQTPFFKNMSFATITKPWSLTELVIKCVHTGTQCPLLCPSTSSRSCTRAPAPCPNSSMGMLGKRVCSY